jgi:hypothetical protein
MGTDLLDFLAERQWLRMTRSGVPWAEITEGDKRACRSLVAPIATDLAEWEAEREMYRAALSMRSGFSADG